MNVAFAMSVGRPLFPSKADDPGFSLKPQIKLQHVAVNEESEACRLAKPEMWARDSRRDFFAKLIED